MSTDQRTFAAAVVDVVLVAVFVLIGRAGHREPISTAEFLVTFWPFAVALAAGWLAVRAWRAPFAIGRTGLPLWPLTVGLGMVLRIVSGQGVGWPFVLVATIVLGAFLLGWRVLLEALERRSTRPSVRRR